MEKTTLIQRLKKPIGLSNVFSFGGGLANGGLNDKAADILLNIWDFDYMGSSSFEYGNIPNAFAKIAEYTSEGNIHTATINVGKDVSYICKKGTETNVEDIIKQLAKDEGEFDLKKPSHFKRVIENDKDYKRTVGWLELDNAFMFFTDKKMYEKIATVFAVKYKK